LDTIEKLYRTGVTIREISRRTGVHFSSVRWRLIACGLHRVKSKRSDNGSVTCSRCHERKPLEEFPWFTYGDYRCRPCLRAGNAEQQLRRRGFSLADYQALWEAQNGKCAICGVKEGHRSRYGRACQLALDHDHRTGKARGLLCNSCNRGLGRFKDSIEVLEAAVRYLKREQ
jgi:hypothetical protein